MRENPKDALATTGSHLTGGEMRLIEDIRRKTAQMSDYELTHALISGLRKDSGVAPAQPSAPGWRGSDPGAGPASPARPGR